MASFLSFPLLRPYYFIFGIIFQKILSNIFLSFPLLHPYYITACNYLSSVFLKNLFSFFHISTSPLFFCHSPSLWFHCITACNYPSSVFLKKFYLASYWYAPRLVNKRLHKLKKNLKKFFRLKNSYIIYIYKRYW